MTPLTYALIIFVAIVSALAAQADAVTYTTSLSAAELETKIQSAFTPNYRGQLPVPLTGEWIAIPYTLTNPTVALVKGTDRVGLAIDVELTIPLMPPIKGKARMNSGVEYRREHSAFYLKDPMIEHLEFEGMPGKYQDHVRSGLQYLVSRRGSNAPVYVMTSESVESWGARLFLRSVVVNEQTGRLDVTWGL
jgi:hypothetical protein